MQEIYRLDIETAFLYVYLDSVDRLNMKLRALDDYERAKS